MRIALLIVSRALIYLPKVFIVAYIDLWRTYIQELLIITFFFELGDLLIFLTSQQEAEMAISGSMWLLVLGVSILTMINATISGYEKEGKVLRGLTFCLDGLVVHVWLLVLISRYVWKGLLLM